MKNFILFLCAVVCLFSGLATTSAYAGGDSFTQKDRELLIRLDERLNQIDKRFEQIDKRFEEFRQDMNKRFEQVDKRFEQVDKRFEQIDKRFEQVNKRFESLQNLMMAIVGAFAAIVAVTIGFAIWDRRTMVRPFEDKVNKVENEVLTDRKKLEALFEILRNYAKNHPDLADILKQFSIL